MEKTILQIYKDEYLPQVWDNPITYRMFFEHYSRNKLPMEEILKIKKWKRWWDRRSHKWNSRIFRHFKEQWYKWSLSHFIKYKHYIYADNNDIDVKLL
jgi:hypothetical protein